MPDETKTDTKTKQSALNLDLSSDVTDKALFVRTSEDELEKWDISRITDSIAKETGISQRIAAEIAQEVESQIFEGKIKFITARLIRELVLGQLLDRGLEEAHKRYSRLGFPIYDVQQIIENETNKDNANVPHGPEATNLTLAEGIKKEYALLRVFSPDVSDAHARGDIHLHDLGMIDRPYCSGQSLEYVKKYGLDLTSSLSQAKPAKHPEVLIAHLIKLSAALQCHFSGAIGWDAVNIFLAPYLEGRDEKSIKQLAQVLIYEFSQQAVARGGQAIFSDINLYWEIPSHFEDVPAIGPGGKYTGKTYKEYLKESQAFFRGLFEVYLEGDGSGRPFFFPKPLVHITEKFFQAPGHEECLEMLSRVAAEKGNTYFVFDRRNEAKISECCRLSFKLEKSDIEDAKKPWRMRYSALQNISLNLPRIAYRAGGNDEVLFSYLKNMMETAVKAHRQKRVFLEHLLKKGSDGPLGLLAIKKPDDEHPYLRLHRVTHLIGIVGLNEMVQYHLGEELHEGRQAVKFGLKVIAYLKLLCEKLSARYGIRLVLEQTPAETTAYRFAKLDLRWYSRAARSVAKGNLTKGEVYYTNSTQINVGAEFDPLERIRREGLFHPLIEAGALTHIWLGESRPPAKGIAALVEKSFRLTENAQVAFSPEFIYCDDCGFIKRGTLREGSQEPLLPEK
ncbi:MAG: anaerobic ribonucleoside-triphosphate reductase [Candidatus Moranbacteria bacterium]|nr:anaerobic ribonucleoside-triphosphate reductase [Candidatus Moranbacteria bacterium]